VPEVQIADEPAEDNPDAVSLIFRLPVSGERITRRFTKGDTVGYLYQFILYLTSKGDCSFEIESNSNYGAAAQEAFSY
jgi:hypothetical protein